MLFDPDEVDVAAFSSRLAFMATQEGENTVLRVFPFCLKGRALEWHNGLSPECKNEMAQALDITIDELRLCFTFEKADELPLTAYITRKINLLRAASIKEPVMVKQLLLEGLESNLSLITPLIPVERLDDFRRRIRDNESAARRAWNSQKLQFTEYALHMDEDELWDPDPSPESDGESEYYIEGRALRVLPRLRANPQTIIINIRHIHRFLYAIENMSAACNTNQSHSLPFQ
ncbi:hypothetical protein ACJ73_03495 [Blastomyces percursus]|uniref:Retrotransposon gag domain-containing protein n=1 Tax=Blastomyces percursus TaxID=1658174 RepID=A0A1J9QAQ7_9EURO|nr:hypothetical protein ACJ73_03495 [Blastomyces percursus]